MNTVEEDLELAKELEEKAEGQKKKDDNDEAKDSEKASGAEGDLAPRLDDVHGDSEKDDAHLEETNDAAEGRLMI